MLDQSTRDLALGLGCRMVTGIPTAGPQLPASFSTPSKLLDGNRCHQKPTTTCHQSTPGTGQSLASTEPPPTPDQRCQWSLAIIIGRGLAL
mmetsp:Transcript_117356/g.204372  ORF Transcript_117356/g.204372 Transcript_117356/m.204372 type:complete len:91 (+) Transcript_117356:740-1012(+)